MSLKEMTKVDQVSSLGEAKCYVIAINRSKSFSVVNDYDYGGWPPYKTEYVHYVDQYWTEDENLWKETIKELYTENKDRTDIKAYIICQVAQIKTKFTVNVSL